MPTVTDELFLFTINRVPAKLLEYRLRLGYKPFFPPSADKTDHPDSWLFSRGPLATIRTAIFLFVIDRLPETQRWLFYWIVLFSRQIFVRQVYVAAHLEILLLWYWPAISPSSIYFINILGDGFARLQLTTYGVFAKEIEKSTGWQLFWLFATLKVLGTHVGAIDLIPWLESTLGPAELWPKAIFPIWIGEFLIDERESITAFTPEGTGGISMAVVVWVLSKTPYWVQWIVWPIFSCPKANMMGLKWLLCTLTWLWYDIPPQVGYGLYLFMNQFPQAEHGLRHEGGNTPLTLKRERYGWVCYILTSVFLNGFKNFLPLAIWLLLVAIYWLMHIYVKHEHFKHKPVKQHCIRLLRLRARSIRDEIQCDLIHVSLDSPPKYTAISYRWNTSNEVQTIQIDGAPFIVSTSIYNLLRAKRRFRHHTLFWIDSICIDQTNTMEKSEQVGLMRKIYEEAHSTIAWLGDDPGSEKVMALIRNFHKARKLPEGKSDWDGLLQLFSNPWFERSWIIQEIAASTNPMIRYGKEEVEWAALMDTLFLIIVHSSIEGSPEDIIGNRQLLNALVIETARLCVENVDYMCLEDILKLGIVFKATLSVDKVFALLGIAEERRHIDYSAGTPNSEYWHAQSMFKELDITLHAVASLKGATEGYANSRRSRRILAHPNGLRYAEELLQYEKQITRELMWLAKRNMGSNEKFSMGYDVLRPEYSKHMTPESVYALVAKTALSKGGYSIIRHAGIGFRSNPELKLLPSWAPDWSSELDAYMLPYYASGSFDRTGDINGSSADGTDTTLHDQWENAHSQGAADFESRYESVRDVSFWFHSIKGVVIGNVQQLVTLTENPSFSGDIFEAAKRDLHERVSNYNKALTIALECCSSLHQTQQSAANEFLSTVALVGEDGLSFTSNSIVDECKLYIADMLNIYNIKAAIWPERYPNHWKDYVQDSDALLKARERLCRKYILFRQTQVSSHAKFAHMIKTEIIPSFNQYRWSSDKKRSSDPYSNDGKTSGRSFSFFDDNKYDLLSQYFKYVDYAIGRKFVILDSGHMGLVPWGTQMGDIVIRPENQSLCLTLRKSVPPMHSHVWQRPLQSQLWQATYSASGVQSTEPIYRLVGESYITNSHFATYRYEQKDEVDFILW